MLTETEASVNNARDDVIKKAQQVASAAQEVAKNTQITATNTQTAQQAATSALSSSQSADESENMARKWASNPENEVVLDEKYSAYHYAQKAAQLAVNLASAESSATQSATIATQKAEEATQAAKKAESLAVGEVDYAKVLNVPRSNINTEGVVRLTNDTGLESESLALTAKAGKKLAQLIATVQLALNNYIPLNKRSSAVNSNDENNVATSKAVKTAYDKGVEAEELANTKWTAKSATETEPGILPISHKTDGADKNKFASEYAVGEAAKKGLPLGAVVSFPRAVTNPNGFLRANGSTFNASAFPDLYKVLGNSNTLPDLTRSDVGMTAYFAVDNIPAGWIAFDEIATQVTEQRYPELYRHLIDKYGSINSVPKVADRFLRNAGNGLSVGQIQEDDLKRHVHRVPIDYDSWFDDSSQGRNNSYFDYTTFAQSSDLWSTLGYDNADGDNGFVSPKDTSQMATGGDETRPKSLVLKLCIKALNSFDDVVFWIKSHGEVTNAGTLDAGRLAQDIQQLSAKTQQIERQSNQNEKLSLELKNQLSQIKNKEPTSRKIWQGNVTNGSGVLTLSESIINKNLVFYLQSSSRHTLSNNDVNTVSCYIDSTLPDVRRTRFAFTAYWDGGLRNFKIEIVSEKQIKLIDASSFYLKMITASD
ncbi:tail fiber protein [Haemophilus influenzae]|uniref:tail fiber protein n=1 Tax=Haemophilus influenzae TaxID=727 RepID=UPI003FCD6401